MKQNSAHATPTLSIVAAARNDGHGGNLLERIRLFVDGLTVLCERHALAAELVLVEWNPPADRAPLAEAVGWVKGPCACGVRIITVPPEVHRRFAHSEALPLFQMIAKNVGIRRARGRFVLATNVDVLLSDALVAFCASGGLQRERLYRMDRCDVPESPPDSVSIDELLSWCAQNVFRIHARDGTTNLRTGDKHVIYVPGRSGGRERLHTNACGDFQLMAAEHWRAVRGYAEFETYSMHLDSLLSFTAHFSGAREQVLADPMCLYHLEHTGGWTPEGARSNSLDARLDATQVPQFDHARFDAWAQEMTRSGRPMIFNDEDWGLANDAFAERCVVSPSWERVTAGTETALAQ